MLSRFRGCISGLAASALLTICPAGLSAQDLHGWGVDSLVSAVQLVGVEQFGPTVKFALRNVSKKPISAIVVATPDNVHHTIDYFGEGELPPGAVWSLGHAISDGNRVLRTLAVVFVDGSAQGLRRWVDLTRGTRLGRALEVRRLQGILSTLPLEETQSDAGIQVLFLRVGPLPATAEDALGSVRDVHVGTTSVNELQGAEEEILSGFLTGVRSAREAALRELTELSQLPTSTVEAPEGVPPLRSRSAFRSSLEQKYEKLTARQERELEVMQ